MDTRHRRPLILISELQFYRKHYKAKCVRVCCFFGGEGGKDMFTYTQSCSTLLEFLIDVLYEIKCCTCGMTGPCHSMVGLDL